jgi:hypothetical protein
MDLEECNRIVDVLTSTLKVNITIQCQKWDGDPKTKTARGYFTADPVVNSAPNNNNNNSAVIVLIPERVYGGEKEIHELLQHELVHAFDHCELRKDLTLCEELACSEIRAAREAECSTMINPHSSFTSGLFCNSIFGKNTQFCENLKRKCVEKIAIRSTKSVFSKEQAEKCVRSVFDQCYADLRGPKIKLDRKFTQEQAQKLDEMQNHAISVHDNAKQ